MVILSRLPIVVLAFLSGTLAPERYPYHSGHRDLDIERTSLCHWLRTSPFRRWRVYQCDSQEHGRWVGAGGRVDAARRSCERRLADKHVAVGEWVLRSEIRGCFNGLGNRETRSTRRKRAPAADWILKLDYHLTLCFAIRAPTTPV